MARIKLGQKAGTRPSNHLSLQGIHLAQCLGAMVPRCLGAMLPRCLNLLPCGLCTKILHFSKFIHFVFCYQIFIYFYLEAIQDDKRNLIHSDNNLEIEKMGNC